MKKIIFGSACMISGLLLSIIMLLVAAFPDSTVHLNFVGHCILWGGIIIAVFGTGLCLANLSDTSETDIESPSE